MLNLKTSGVDFLYQFGGDENKVLENPHNAETNQRMICLQNGGPYSEKTVKGQAAYQQNRVMRKKIEASDEELDDEIRTQSAQSGMSEEDFKNYIEQNNIERVCKTSASRNGNTYDMPDRENSKVQDKVKKIKFLDFIQTKTINLQT